jgi:WD40 repeat protein
MHDAIPAPSSLRPDVDKSLEAICLKALARRPEDRYRSAVEFADALESFLRPAELMAGGGRSRTVVGWIATAAAALLLLAGIIYIKTGEGTLVLEVNESDVRVTIDEKRVEIQSPRDMLVLTVPTGSHRIEVTKDGFVTWTDSFRIRRNGKTELTATLKTVAEHVADNVGRTDLAHSVAAKERRPGKADLPALPPASPLAFVARPAVLPGVKSWNIETRKHRGRVWSVAYSPNGDRVATGCEDGTIRVWDTTTGDLRNVFVGHRPGELGVAWSSDSRFLASTGGAHDYSGIIRDADSGQVIRAMVGGSGRTVAWSPDGKHVATNGVLVFDVDSDKRTGFGDDHQPNRPIAWSRDGGLLAYAGKNSTLCVLDLGTGQVKVTPIEESEINGLAWSTDNVTLAVVGNDKGALEFRNAKTGELIRKALGTQPYNLAAWSPDGRHIATFSGEIRILDAQDGHEVQNLSSRGQSPRCLAWSPDSKNLVQGHEEGVAELWNVERGQLLHSWRGLRTSINRAAMSPDNKKLAVLGLDDTRGAFAALWDLSTATCTHPDIRLDDFSNALAWSPNGKLIAVGNRQGGVEIIDANEGIAWYRVKEAGKEIRSLAWSADETRLAVGGESGTVRVWDVSQGTSTLIKQFSSHKAGVTALAWSPNGETLVSLSEEGTLGLWNSKTDEMLPSRKIANSRFYAIAWSPDGATFATQMSGERRESLALWNTQSDKPIRVFYDLKGQTSGYPYTSLQFSNDGSQLVGSYEDGFISHWDVKSGKYLEPSSAAESPSAFPKRFIPIWNWDNGTLPTSAVHLFDTSSGEPRGTLLHLPKGGTLAIGPDGHWRGTDKFDEDFVYVVVTDRRQETLTSADFSTKYGWKNDAQQVRISGSSSR